MVGQRIIGEALGYPDINDHDRLRHDPLLGLILGKLSVRDKRCAPLAGKSTLNRLEHSPEEGEARAPHRYHKISHDIAAIDRLLLDIFRQAEDAERGGALVRVSCTIARYVPPNSATGQVSVAKRQTGNDLIVVAHDAVDILRVVHAASIKDLDQLPE